MALLELFSSRRPEMDLRRSKGAGTPSMWWRCRWEAADMKEVDIWTCSYTVFLFSLKLLFISKKKHVQVIVNITIRACRRCTTINLLTVIQSKLSSCLIACCVCCAQEKTSGRTAHYKLTSTVMLWLQTTKTGSGTMNLGGSLTRQVHCQTKQKTAADLCNLSYVIGELKMSCLFTDGKGWVSWRVRTPHRQHRPPCWSEYDGW